MVIAAYHPYVAAVVVTRPRRLEAQDTALSRLRHGFESRRGQYLPPAFLEVLVCSFKLTPDVTPNAGCQRKCPRDAANVRGPGNASRLAKTLGNKAFQRFHAKTLMGSNPVGVIILRFLQT